MGVLRAIRKQVTMKNRLKLIGAYPLICVMFVIGMIFTTFEGLMDTAELREYWLDFKDMNRDWWRDFKLGVWS